MWKRMLKAAKFARKAHGDQRRAHGAPYYKHPMAVARILWNKGYRGAVIEAAFLHDVCEDTGLKPILLFESFGLHVARLVGCVTKMKGEPREEYFRRIKDGGKEAMALKLADREHNNSELELAPPECESLRKKAKEKTELMLKIFC